MPTALTNLKAAMVYRGHVPEARGKAALTCARCGRLMGNPAGYAAGTLIAHIDPCMGKTLKQRIRLATAALR